MEYPSDRQQRQRQQQRSACPPYSQQHWFPIQQPQPQSVSPSLPWPAPFGLRTVPEESSTDVDRSPLVSGGGGGGVADVAVSCSYPKRGRCVILGPSRSDSDANGVSNSSSSSSMDCSDDDNHEDEPFIPTCKRRRLWAPPLPNPGESNNNSAVRHPFPEPNILLWEDSRFEPHHAPACSSNHNKNDNDNKNSNNNTNHNHHTEARELLPWWKKKQKPQRRILVEQDDDDDDDECMEDPNERGGRSNSASAVCCHVCCGSFVPPPAPAVRSVMPANALLRYVSVSVNGGNGADTDTVRGCGSGFLPRSSPSASPAGCPSCDRPTCPECWNRCGVCQRDFCSFCTVSHHRSASVSGMVCADCG